MRMKIKVKNQFYKSTKPKMQNVHISTRGESVDWMEKNRDVADVNFEKDEFYMWIVIDAYRPPHD